MGVDTGQDKVIRELRWKDWGCEGFGRGGTLDVCFRWGHCGLEAFEDGWEGYFLHFWVSTRMDMR